MSGFYVRNSKVVLDKRNTNVTEELNVGLTVRWDGNEFQGGNR